MKIKIGNRFLGDDEPTIIIAEIGSNHNQDISLAYEAIDAAIESGADAIKFQSIKLNHLYYKPSKEIEELHKKIDLDERWHYKLKEYCDEKNVIFFSSPTYMEAVDILEDVGVEVYKLASAQIGTFPQIIDKVAKTGKPTLISAGIVSYGELERAIKIFKARRNDKFIILHCNSMYPTPYDKVNLKLINIYKSMFGNPVGFSDHTLDIYISIAAVGIGAKVIEKHFTIDRKIPTPDADISLEPPEFKKLVTGIRAVEQALKESTRIDIEPEEKEFKQSIIYRLILKKDKERGDSFDINDFEFKRHYEGIDSRDIDYVLKYMRAKKVLKGNTLLKWDMLEGI